MKHWLCIVLLALSILPATGQTVDSLHIVDSLNGLAGRYYQRSLDSTMLYSQQALGIAERLGYKKGQAGALNNMGIVYNLSNNSSLSFRYYSDALRLHEELGDSAEVVKLLMNIGLTLNDKGDDARARRYFWDAMSRGARLKKDSVVSLLLINYATVFVDSLPLDSIRFYLDKASEIADRYHDRRDILNAEEAEGQLALAAKDTALGLSELWECVRNGRAYKEYFFITGVLNEIANTYLPSRPDSAIFYYNEALAVSREKGYHSYTKWSSQKLYDYYYAKGDVPKALAAANQLLTIYKNQEDAVNTSGVNYMDYAIAQEQLEAARARSENRKLMIVILGTVCLFSVVVALILFRLYRLKGERNQDLQQKQEFNSKLVSLLAHDFRQPIITARGLATLLKEPGGLTREEMQRIVQSIEVSSDTAIDIFENILQWIKRQISGFRYEPVPLPLKDLVNQAMRPFIGLGETVRIVNSVSETITIQGDKELVQFVQRNLIHNALKFSPERGTVSISAEVTSQEIVVCVRDQGKGINPEKLLQLFNFKKDLQYDNDTEKGAGVALMICKDFVDRMGGRIWAENGEPRGAMFFYALPLTASPNGRHSAR
jgi:signal transduction histidine kinase